MNLDLFPLMCYILNIEPTPNNASFERVRKILKDEGRRWTSQNGPLPTPHVGVTVEYEYSASGDGLSTFLYCKFTIYPSVHKNLCRW